MLLSIVLGIVLVGSVLVTLRYARRVRELEEESDDSDRLRARLAELLTGVARALKGPPPPLTLHDWSDLPRVADAMRGELEWIAGIDARAILDAPEVWPAVLASARAALAGPDAVAAHRARGGR